MLRRLLLLAMLALLTACTSAVTLRQPRTGAIATCGPYYTVGLYAFAANERERQCISDYQRLGYERVPEGFRESPSPPTTTPVAVSPSTGLNGTFAGEITGTVRGQPFSMRVTFTLVHSGDQLVGVWNTTAGTSGTVQGVVSGGQVPDFRVKQVNPCEGTFTGAAVIEAGRLRGSYTGGDCSGSVTASFVVTRQ